MEEIEYCTNCPYNNTLPVIFNNGVCEYEEKCRKCQDDLVTQGKYIEDKTVDYLCDELSGM